VSWPTINKSETDFRRELDVDLHNLNYLEGIWICQVSRIVRNLETGQEFPLSTGTPYRIAIVRDTTYPNYEFVAVILESQYEIWTAGRVKAYFRKTAYPNIYEALWYMRNYEQKRATYEIDENGMLTASYVNYISKPPAQMKTTTKLMKAYPIISGKKITSVSGQYKASGSGFLISESGLVITNYHVVEGASQIEIVFPERQITKTASIRIKDINNDIAILHIEDLSFPEIANHGIPFTFATVNSIKVGQEVFTLGFPFGDIMGTRSRLSIGHINSEYGLQDDPRLFQISNPLQPGNSGGPLYNNKGELVGIVVSGLNAKYFYENVGIIPQNVNFAVKVSYIKNLVAMLSEGDHILNRINSVKQTTIEEQIEQINPFVVQIRIY
jgi:serine protease Do